MGLESVEDLAIHEIFKKLPPDDIGRVACVSKSFRSSASEDHLWIHVCFHDLGLTEPLDHLGNRLPTFKATYQAWREAFVMYPWPLVKRVKRCWDTIKTWLINNFPEAEASLCKGASEAEIQELEDVLQVKLPLPTRILYRFYNGQEIVKADLTTSIFGTALGLIGGYSFYNYSVNVYLLPTSQVIQETQRITRHLGFSRRSKYVLIAASSTYTEKMFFLNCTNGQLYVGTMNLDLPFSGQMIPCVPHDLISLGHELNSEQQQDAMLLWLEEHGRRLQHGFIKLKEGDIRSINLFPEEPPLCTTAVTNGVQVRGSALLIPELINLRAEHEKYCFAYSIRISLEPQGCIFNGMSINSCELYWRHWITHGNNDEEMSALFDVKEQTVVGKFRQLRPDDKEFVYGNYTYLPTSGSIHGSLTFIPGRWGGPEGDPLEVTVAGFPLQLPDYVF